MKLDLASMLESYACQWHNDFELLTLSDMVPGLETVLTVLMRRLSKYSPSDFPGVFWSKAPCHHARLCLVGAGNTLINGHGHGMRQLVSPTVSNLPKTAVCGMSKRFVKSNEWCVVEESLISWLVLMIHIM